MQGESLKSEIAQLPSFTEYGVFSSALIKVCLVIPGRIFSDKDDLLGVSSNIMLGQVIKSGTGYCDILLDEQKLIESLDDIEEKEEEYIDIDESNIDILLEKEDEGECCDDNFKFSHE